ncbi:MAG: glycosyl hydrolase [Bacteroidales bacterium]|nr:glycosyl hydrolase [Bacteroidales bacterium]
MNRLIPIIAAAAVMTACSGKKTQQETEEPATVTPAQTLIARLDSTVNAGKFYFGHHDDTAYGHTWAYVDGNSDVKAVTGQYPGMMNWDLGLLELDSLQNLDGVPFEFMSREIAAQHARGGINGISWHPINPVSRGNSWDTSTSPLHGFTDNPAVLDTLTAWIDRAADFIGSLTDSEGHRIPVIFRPWHENSGSWFWWGSDYTTPDEYIALYRLTRERFDAKDLDNVVWAYSPDKDLTREQYLATYPGDEYVDILGTDIYQFDGEEGIDKFRERVAAQMPFVIDEARRRGKLVALTETGLEGLTVPDWYTRVLLPAIDGMPLAYVCVWRNGNESTHPNHYYVPFPGHPAVDDFKKFHDTGKALFID